MLNYLSENIDNRLTAVNNSELSTEEKFRAIFQNQFIFFAENPHFVVAVFSDGLMEESTKINETILSLLFVKIKHLLPVLAEGQKDGSFRNDIQADELMQIIMGTFRLLMLCLYWFCKPPSTDSVKSASTQMSERISPN